MSYALLYTPTFNDCVDAHRTDPKLVLAAYETARAITEQPFGNPRIQTHEVKRAQGRTFTSYIDNQGHRLIWRLVKQTIVLLLFGEHDSTYRRAERLRVEIDPATDVVAVHDVAPATGERAPYSVTRQRTGRLFMAWRDAELADWGFEDHEIEVLRTLDTDGDLLELEARMHPATFERAFNLAAYGHPDGEHTPGVDDGPVLHEEPPADDPAEEDRLERELAKPGAAGEFVPIEPDFLREVLDKPIEDWMVFLHPDQARLARRAFSGPARIRGAAGTGKTVVALHRAAHLARSRSGPILFTTFISSLPKVLEALFALLAPDVSDRVEFTNIHQWARDYLDDHKVPHVVSTKKSDAAFNSAWAAVAVPGSTLAGSSLPKRYFSEEISAVIKGRAIADLETYLEIDRPGRRTPLGPGLRREVWALFEHYQIVLRRSGHVDYADLLSLALQRLETASEPSPYAAVVVDEAQDLSEVGICLVHHLADGNKADGLLLVGDGQQSVYPGGYTLAGAGISVVGRSVVLRTNYRNTAAILRAAMRVVEDAAFIDGDLQPESGRRDVVVLREGEAPTISTFENEATHDRALVDHVRELLGRPGVSPGDLAILVRTNNLVSRYRTVIEGSGFETIDLRWYEGRPINKVKVGTYLRAKGLEFKHVLVPRVDLLDREAGGSDTPVETSEMFRRQLFVAMGRARDGLWVGACGDTPSLRRDTGA